MKTKQKLINKDIKIYSLFKQSLIGITIGSFIITQSMAIGIEPVTNWNLYPIPQEVASTSRGGLTNDKVAISDGIGAILLYGTSGGQTQTNNASFNQLLNSNVNNLNDTNPTLNGLIVNNVITVPSNTLNDINNNIFVGGTATYLHTNGTACDDGNAATTGETWLNDVCQGGTAPTLVCADGLIEENGVCYQKLATEVCGTDGIGTYNSTTHMCEGASLNFSSFGLGVYHTCAIDNVGDTYCWGYNYNGNLGIGTIDNNPNPIPQKLSKKFIQLSVGFSHTCGIETGTGNTYCWGSNYYGQLGLGNTTDQSTPQKLSKKFTQLFLGKNHTCGIEQGTSDTYCWGNNTAGQLGLGNTTDQSTPQKLSKKFSLISGGFSHTCGIEQGTGDTYCWGYNYSGELGLGFKSTVSPWSLLTPQKLSKKYSTISVGASYTCGIEQGTSDTYCWGFNTTGQLGHTPGTNGDTGTSPDYYNMTPIKTITGLTNIQCSNYVLENSHTCGTDSVGNTYCWGYNLTGQLGLGTAGNKYNTPQLLSKKYSSIKVMGGYTCGIEKNTNNLYCWGDNYRGQLGHVPGTNGDTGTSPNYFNSIPKLVQGTSNYEITCDTANGFQLEVTTGRCWKDKQ